MPSRIPVAKELAEIFKALSHPDRVRLIEELRGSEQDVNTLAERLDLPGPRVSQHLGLLRAQRLVDERRDGRRHLYHLTQPEIADWIVSGLDFVEGRLSTLNAETLEAARRLWAVGGKQQSV
ncbi:MAG: metalloregulator ArsR/SmtB family transcription factor [Pseudomonadota bacterium]